MISVAIEKGAFVYVYDEKNHLLFSKSGQLEGYTSDTVSVRRGDYIYTYDEKGSQISSHYSR